MAKLSAQKKVLTLSCTPKYFMGTSTSNVERIFLGKLREQFLTATEKLNTETNASDTW